ncbi:peroxidase 31-like [Triticum dicoccoides]|uniref:peroxidase 31-like n=1 Tax=Triticum dicoccoides TaxID=85692 RepID=UPI00188DFBFB|nr:peroxidase 31-like [Triticum dicoccoides]
MASSGAIVLAMVGLLAAVLVSPAAAAAAEEFISMPTDDVGDHSYRVHATFCPDLERIVRDKVADARRNDIGVVAGLLRIFFHDCFPNGCDASLLLETSHLYSSERDLPQNKGLHEGALQLIQRIRDAVRDAKCTDVSCADITMLATRDALMMSGAPRYDVHLGRKDSKRPASFAEVRRFLPARDAKIKDLIRVFEDRGFNKGDLVALSGAHTIGKATCPSLEFRTGEPAWFVKAIKDNCPRSGDKKHILDVTTPDVFDNKYYGNLLLGLGVLGTDMELLQHQETRFFVESWAKDEHLGWFHGHFAAAMKKMADLPVDPDGEYRDNCFRPKSFVRNLTADGFSASA